MGLQVRKPNKIKLLIDDMCRKTAYTGSGQRKIFGQGRHPFICGIFKKTKYRSAHEIKQSLTLSVDPFTQFFHLQRLQDCEFQRQNHLRL